MVMRKVALPESQEIPTKRPSDFDKEYMKKFIKNIVIYSLPFLVFVLFFDMLQILLGR